MTVSELTKIHAGKGTSFSTTLWLFKSFVMMFIMSSLALTLGRRMVLMKSLLLFSKAVLSCSHLAWSKFYFSAYWLPPILLAVNMPTYRLFQKISDRSNPSNYLSNVFEKDINQKREVYKSKLCARLYQKVLICLRQQLKFHRKPQRVWPRISMESQKITNIASRSEAILTINLDISKPFETFW